MTGLHVGIFGASGFVGSVLHRMASENGDTVIAFSRTKRPNFRVFESAADLADLDAVVNLAGEPILGLWTKSRRKKILRSRVEGTRKIVEAIGSRATSIRTLINASAIGFYGDAGDRIVDESAPAGNGFLADTCQAWEAEAYRAEDFGTRVVTVRTGFVIGKGGAMRLIRPVFQLGLGGRLGSGRQWMSCVHVEDVAGMILWALHNEAVTGPLNAALPDPVTNAEFTKAVAASVHRPAIFPVPAILLKTLLGDLSHVILDSTRAIPAKAESLSYPFRFSSLHRALERNEG